MKLKFLRRGLKHPKLSSLQVEGDLLLAKIQSEKANRHEVVHGALSNRGGGDAVEMLRVRYEKDTHRSSLHTVTTDEVKAASRRAFDLSDPAVMLGVRLYNLARPQDPIADLLG